MQGGGAFSNAASAFLSSSPNRWSPMAKEREWMLRMERRGKCVEEEREREKCGRKAKLADGVRTGIFRHFCNAAVASDPPL